MSIETIPFQIGETGDNTELVVDELRLKPLADCTVDEYAGRSIAVDDGVPADMVRRQTSAWLKYIHQEIASGRSEGYGIYGPEGMLVGDIVVSDAQSPSPEIMYRIATDSRGRGIATRSVRAVAAHVFAEHRAADAIRFEIHTSNDASQHVAERVGAVRQAGRDGEEWETWRLER